MPRSTSLKNSIIDAICNATAFSVATPYISLHTADPGGTGAAECTGGSYARQLGSFGAAATGAASNDANVDFVSMPACTVTYMGVWTAVTVGTWLWGGILTASKVVNAGDTFRFAIGNLTLSDVNV